MLTMDLFIVSKSIFSHPKKMTTSIETNRELIVGHERKLANLIAREVIDKPTLSLWMIVIPIVFVYYFYGLNRYKSGKRGFVKHFLFSKGLILDQAVEFLENGTKPNFDELASREHVPDNALEAHKNWTKSLYDHYLAMLESEGDSYADLVKARYKNKGTYLLIVNQITNTEKQLYKALRKNLEKTDSSSRDVISKMAKSLEHLRRDEVNFMFG